MSSGCVWKFGVGKPVDDDDDDDYNVWDYDDNNN